MKDVVDSLLFNLQDYEKIPVTTDKLTATIRNKVYKYKETVESKEVDEGQSLNDFIYTCYCKNSEFCDPDYGHIITGNLSLIKNQKIKKIFSKGPNFREPQSLNYFRCKKEIDRAIEESAGILRLIHKLEDTAMDLWVNKGKEKVKSRIKSLKKSKFTMLPLYCKMKMLGSKSKFFNQNFVLSPLIKHQTNLFYLSEFLYF